MWAASTLADTKSLMHWCCLQLVHVGPSDSPHISKCVNKEKSSADINMYYFWFWQTSNSISRARTRVIVCLAVHTARRCVFYVCFFFILTWKGTSTPIYYLLKIKPWRQTTVISVGQLPLAPSFLKMHSITAQLQTQNRGKKFPCKQVDPGRTSDRLDGISPSDLRERVCFLRDLYW